jgi:hypothetical protein
VQDGGVVARGRDGVVAQLVAHLAGTGEESTLHNTLTAGMRQCPGEGLHHLFETFHGGGDCELHLLDFPLILEQAKLGEGFAELFVERVQDSEVQVVRVFRRVVAGRVHKGVDVFVHLAHQADGDAADFRGAHVLGDGSLELVDVRRGQAQAGLELGQRGTGTNPELAGA